MIKSYLYIALALAAFSAVSFITYRIYEAGKDAIRTEVLTRSVENLNARKNVDEKINSADNDALCRAIGGSVWKNNECQ